MNVDPGPEVFGRTDATSNAIEVEAFVAGESCPLTAVPASNAVETTIASRS